MPALILFLCMIMPGLALASGPPRTVGHLDIEFVDSGIRVTLGMPYTVAQNAGGFVAANSSQAFTDELFANTLGEKPLLSNGKSCEWGKPLSIVSFAAVKLQATAICKRPPRQLTVDLPFLGRVKGDFRTSVKLHPYDLPGRVEMSKQTTRVTLDIEGESTP